MAVDSVHPHYSNMVSSWEKMADVCSCEEVIHLNGELYLPRLSNQNDIKYDSYKNRASFVTFTKRTIEAFCGMVMRKEVHVDGYSSINFDGKGGDINSYVGNLIEQYLKYGRCGTLIDVPKVEGSITIADEIEKNVFPRAVFYSAADIINWKTSVINNIETLSMVVLREAVDRAEDEFEHDTVYRYRVLDLGGENGTYRQRLYDDGSNLIETINPLAQGKPLPFIPFFIHGGISVKYPPLLSVADQNIHHYQLDADYKYGLHMVALPTPYIIGMSPDDVNAPRSIGPSTIWFLDDTEARCGMLEFTGAGLSQIANAMDTAVEIIVVMASRVIAPEKSSNDESALAAAIRSNAETSSLAAIVSTLSKEMENAVRTIVFWSGGDPAAVTVDINSDFMPSELTGTDVLSYITAWIKGGISYSSLFNVLKRGEIIKGDRTLEEEAVDIDKEQRERLQKEIEKTEKMTEAEGKGQEDEEDGLRKIPDPEAKLKLDRRVV